MVNSLLPAMKKCPYCGQENSDDATRCGECGSETWLRPAPGVGTDAPGEKITVLEYEVQAEHLAAELTSRNIPHVMRCYHDSALDGLFQLSQGWGHVEAPVEYKAAILSILKDLQTPPSTPPTPMA